MNARRLTNVRFSGAHVLFEDACISIRFTACWLKQKLRTAPFLLQDALTEEAVTVVISRADESVVPCETMKAEGEVACSHTLSATYQLLFAASVSIWLWRRLDYADLLRAEDREAVRS